MYLSRIELHGFKSFADRTILQLSNGLTAIVGPNGSGKTNIIDAIRWVLGEQKTSLLRTDAMNQVIFNGTRTRKPLGMAEVSIVIENTQKILPAEFSEVVVTRRLFRDGESQYLLNGSLCRRKDIIDLFTDTGMGADAYSVIELKMVEQILEDHSDERRHLFEEAAGIVKYKQRRKETLAKLEATRHDIDRVIDHIAEVRRTVGSLKRQAERAERFAALNAELRALETERLFRTWNAHRFHLDQLIGHQRLLQEQLEALASSLTSENERIVLLQDRIHSLEQQVDELHTREQQLLTEQNAHSKECAIIEERLRSTQNSIDSLLEHIRSRSTTHDRIERDLETCHTQLTTALEELQKSDVRIAELRSSLNNARKSYEELLTTRSQCSDPLRALERDHERLQTMRSHVRQTVDQLSNRAKRLRDELDPLRACSLELERRIEITTTEREQVQVEITQCEQALTAAHRKKHELEAAIEQLQQSRHHLAERLTQCRAQHSLLESIVHQNELDPKLLERAPVRPIYTLGDLITATDDVAIALESALGNLAQYPVVETRHELELLGNWLCSDLKRKAHIICLELIAEHPRPVPLPNDANAQWLVEFVTASTAITSLLRWVLEGIVLIESLSDAESLFMTFPSVHAAVDRKGQIRTRYGIVRLGIPSQTEGLRIGRQQRLHELVEEIAQLEQQHRSIEHQLADARSERVAINLDALNAALRAAERKLLAVDQTLNNAISKRAHLASTIERLHAELKAIADEQTALLAQDVALDKQLQNNEQQQAELIEQQEEINERIKQFEQMMSDYDQKIRSSELEATRIRARIESLRDTIARLEHQRQQLLSDQEDTQAEREHLQVLRSQLQDQLNEKSRLLSDLSSQLEILRAKRQQLDDELTLLRSEHSIAQQRIESLRTQREQLTTKLHSLEVECEHVRTLQETLTEQIKRQFDIDPAAYQSTTDSPDDVLDAAINRLTSQIAALGAINFSALEEYTSEKQRLDELETQYRDLQRAEANLRDTITEINTTASEQFLRTFEAIRTHFKELFSLLFQGDGDADLLMEGDDPLDAKINIVARPKGKRPTSIDMLSGGEKTLTAIALLFAIYLVKPSPFCILDEVDAPLDDANIDRYLTLIRQFSATTQFLLITHNKRTMEAADVLYGVTMQEPGVSKIVSVRLTNPHDVPLTQS